MREIESLFYPLALQKNIAIMYGKGVQAPIIALTAYAMEGNRQKCLDATTTCPSLSIKANCRNCWVNKNSDSLAAQADTLCKKTQQLAHLCQEAADPQKPAKAPTDKQS